MIRLVTAYSGHDNAKADMNNRHSHCIVSGVSAKTVLSLECLGGFIKI